MNAYLTDLKQSTAPLKWTLDPNYANSCQTCFMGEPGYLGRQGVSLSRTKSLIDIESEMKLLHLPLSRNPNLKHLPDFNQPHTAKINYNDCNFKTNYTRLTNPSCTLRGTGVNRFQPMCLNFQDEQRWFYQRIGTNQRMLAKDQHVAKVPRPMDQLAALPSPHTKLPDLRALSGNRWAIFTGALHPYYKK